MTTQPSAGESLLAAYQKWKALQDRPPGTGPERQLNQRLAKAGAAATAQRIARATKAVDVETVAYRKSVSRVARASDRGAAPTAALAAGFARYKKLGGGRSFATWRARVAEGRP